jgi:RNA processing factor Prp31
MNKLLAAIVASTFAFAATAGMAADAVKKEELTQDQRTEMRNRADRLIKERAQAPTQVKADKQGAPKAKAPHAKKTKKVSKHSVKKAAPKA